MRIVLYQFPTTWMDITSNLDRISQVAHAVKGAADIVFLHEMFTTGYTMKPASVPHEWQQICVDVLSQLAHDTGLLFTGTLPYYSQDTWTNRLLVIGKNGIMSSYDKVHLFTPAGEKDVYTAGNDAVFLEWNEWTIRPMICYDLRFPYLSFRSPVADLLFFSANWPKARIQHWHTLLKARAVENQCYVIGVNRTGTDAHGYEYPGQSTLISFNGEVMCCLSADEEWKVAHLDRDAMMEYRHTLPFLADRCTIG